jgi:hypothetical protein
VGCRGKVVVRRSDAAIAGFHSGRDEHCSLSVFAWFAPSGGVTSSVFTSSSLVLLLCFGHFRFSDLWNLSLSIYDFRFPSLKPHLTHDGSLDACYARHGPWTQRPWRYGHGGSVQHERKSPLDQSDICSA